MTPELTNFLQTHKEFSTLKDKILEDIEKKGYCILQHYTFQEIFDQYKNSDPINRNQVYSTQNGIYGLVRMINFSITFCTGMMLLFNNWQTDFSGVKKFFIFSLITLVFYSIFLAKNILDFTKVEKDELAKRQFLSGVVMLKNGIFYENRFYTFQEVENLFAKDFFYDFDIETFDLKISYPNNIVNLLLAIFGMFFVISIAGANFPNTQAANFSKYFLGIGIFIIVIRYSYEQYCNRNLKNLSNEIMNYDYGNNFFGWIKTLDFAIFNLSNSYEKIKNTSFDIDNIKDLENATNLFSSQMEKIFSSTENLSKIDKVFGENALSAKEKFDFIIGAWIKILANIQNDITNLNTETKTTEQRLFVKTTDKLNSDISHTIKKLEVLKI